MGPPAAHAVYALLTGNTEQRDATLGALEKESATIEHGVALAAAPALVELMTASADEVARPTFCRLGLLLGRLHQEAAAASESAIIAVYAAAFGDGRLASLWDAEENVVARLLRKPAAELDAVDAYTYACGQAYETHYWARGVSGPWRAAGFGEGVPAMKAWLALYASKCPVVSQQKLPDDAQPRALLRLLLERLRPKLQQQSSDTETAALWNGVTFCMMNRSAVGKYGLECGVVELAVSSLRHARGPAGCLSISAGYHSPVAAQALNAVGILGKAYSGAVQERKDLVATVASGLVDECLAVVQAFAKRGKEGVPDTHNFLMYGILGRIRDVVGHPGCQAKIRKIPSALAFVLAHDLPSVEDAGMTTAVTGANICAGVFGRDDGGSEFVFTQEQVDMMLRRWSGIVRAVGQGAQNRPGPDNIFALDLVISDDNKPLLMANPAFFSYLVDALLLDPDHPRAGMKGDIKAWCQRHHCEALAQLAAYEPARKALQRDASVVPALEAVAETGLSEEAREVAIAALMALSDKELEAKVEGQKHVMLSYQWDVQAAIKRLNESLIARGYVTWFDLTNMKGSTVDAMSDAIEGADVMLYGVSLRYKESANCRMEANYAHQQELDMIPLMVQKDYSPKGWLGLILGTRIWYPMWDAEKDNNAAFEHRIDSVAREIGDRGKLMVLPEAMTPTFHEPTPAPAPAAAAPAPTPAPAPVGARAPTPTVAPAEPVARAAHYRHQQLLPQQLPQQPPQQQQSAAALSFAAPEEVRDLNLLPDGSYGTGTSRSLLGGSMSSQSSQSQPLSEMFYLQLQIAERERADRERERERERADLRLDRVERERVDRLERERAERAERELRLAALMACAVTAATAVAASVAAAVLLRGR